MGLKIFDRRPLVNGPSGFLDKGEIKNRFRELETLGYVCEGVDNSRCPWPAGAFSKGQAYCEDGYSYSYLNKACYAYPAHKANCSHKDDCVTPT